MQWTLWSNGEMALWKNIHSSSSSSVYIYTHLLIYSYKYEWKNLLHISRQWNFGQIISRRRAFSTNNCYAQSAIRQRVVFQYGGALASLERCEARSSFLIAQWVYRAHRYKRLMHLLGSRVGNPRNINRLQNVLACGWMMLTVCDTVRTLVRFRLFQDFLFSVCVRFSWFIWLERAPRHWKSFEFVWTCDSISSSSDASVRSAGR